MKKCGGYSFPPEQDIAPEWVIEKDFVESMKTAGWLNLKADRLQRGWSDQIFFGHGPRTVIVEFKRSGARKRRGEKLQDYYRDQFKSRGYEVYKVTGKKEADSLLRKLCGRVIDL